MSSEIGRQSFAEKILEYVSAEPGLTDRELCDRIFGSAVHPSQVNQQCRLLLSQGVVRREQRADGRIGNYLDSIKSSSSLASAPLAVSNKNDATRSISEDDVKRHLASWLEGMGWQTTVAWGKAHGIDIVAKRGEASWLIEAKGSGSLQPMRVNYFLAILGETLQRMSEPQAKYSIALPDMAQFRALWSRLPALAKQRTGITAIFVSASGGIEELVN